MYSPWKTLKSLSLPSAATQAQAENGTNNTTYMTSLRVKQSMSANPPRHIWKQQIIVQPSNSINFVTIMNNIGGSGEYLFEIFASYIGGTGEDLFGIFVYQGSWYGEIRFSANSSLSVSDGCIVKISYIDSSELDGTISVYTLYPLDENLLIVELNKKDFDALNKEMRENYLERQKTKNSREVSNESLKRN